MNWIEGFALDRPGHEFTQAPRLLAPLAAMLADRQARRSLTSTSTRSILETVATRIEEQRDLTRYIISLLIFLGLLGTFYGLATVVPAVVDTIRSLAPQEGETRWPGFDSLMTGLEGQLGGMGTAFGSSLLGLSGSLVVGLLELFASHAQNRFYRELEEWLCSITKLGIAGVEPEEALTAANVLTVIGHTAEQIDALRRRRGERRPRRRDRGPLGALVELLARPKPEPAAAVDNALLERIAAGAGAGGASDRDPRRRGRRHRRRDPGAAALDRHPGAAHPRRPRRRAAGPRHRDPPGHRRPRRRAARASRRAGGSEPMAIGRGRALLGRSSGRASST